MLIAPAAFSTVPCCSRAAIACSERVTRPLDRPLFASIVSSILKSSIILHGPLAMSRAGSDVCPDFTEVTENNLMKSFSIDAENSITALDSPEQAQGGEVFHSE